MNAREQARFDMIKRVGTFGTNHAADLTTPVAPNPAITPGQTKAKQLFDSLSAAKTGLIARIGKATDNQESSSGTYHGGTTSKTVLHDALMLELRGINRSAAAIALAQSKPEVMDNFRMPYGVSETKLVAKANAIADAAEAMADDFVHLGHETTFADDLRAHVTAFNNAETVQATGQQSQSGATASFEPLLEEAMMAVKQLDAFMHNFYRSSAEKMGEWHTASHVERQAKKKKGEPAKP